MNDNTGEMAQFIQWATEHGWYLYQQAPTGESLWVTPQGKTLEVQLNGHGNITIKKLEVNK